MRTEHGMQSTHMQYSAKPNIACLLCIRLLCSVRRRGKNIDASSMSNPFVVVEKITTRRREGVGVVVEKNEESRRTFNKNSRDLLTAITHTETLIALYKTNKQFNKKTKL